MASTKAPSMVLSRLEIPDCPLIRSNSQSEQESDYDERAADVTLPEEEVQTVVGVSISRAQTRLISPTIPAAEKAAALDDFDGAALFDGAVEDYPASEHGHNNEILEAEHELAGEAVGRSLRRSHSNASSHASQTLPSPWKASPRIFERPHGQRRGRAPSKTWSSPTIALADLNVKRFMSGFTLPSLPKTPNLKDFSMPSMTSVFGAKEEERKAKNIARQKRVSSDLLCKSQWNGTQRSSPSRSPFRKKAEDEASNILYGAQPPRRSLKTNIESLPRDREHGATASTETASSGALTPKPPSLRRATSDQSLILRRATSTGSSLGDDTRWEGVQGMVNNRMKAIKDSLQDSSIKLPSMPNLSNMNLNSLRPEFFRVRATSDPKRPSGDTSTSRLIQAGVGNGQLGEKQNINPTPTDDFSMPKKSPKSMHLNLDRALEDLTGDLVIMGGYRGSILRSAKPPHRQLWVPVKVGLNIRKVNLEVGLNPEDEETMHENIFASGMLSHIGPVDMGRRLLKRIRESPNCQNGKLRLHDYGWDWRLSPHLLSRRLIEFLDSLPCNAEGVAAQERGATVIAHSMGGLITRHAVNQRPELFKGIIYAGVPQHCINILGPLRNGDDVLLSSKVLTAQVNFTLRTTFLLLPEDGKCFIDKTTREPYPVDFFNVKSWKTYAFSPCIAPSLPPYTQPERKGILGAFYSNLPSLPQPLQRLSPFLASDPTTEAAKEAPAPTTSSLSNSTLNPSTQSTLPLSAALTYLQRTLAATLTFKSQLAHNPSHTYPPLSILYSTSIPTVSAARVACRDAIRCADAYDDLQFASGDGVCLARAAQLPKGYVVVRGGKVRSERGHVGLLGDLEGVGRCLVAVAGVRSGGCGLMGEDQKGG